MTPEQKTKLREWLLKLGHDAEQLQLQTQNADFFVRFCLGRIASYALEAARHLP